MILTLTSLLVIRFPNNCYSIVLTLFLFDFKNKIIIMFTPIENRNLNDQFKEIIS